MNYHIYQFGLATQRSDLLEKKVSDLKKRYKQTYILTVVQLKVRNNAFYNYKALGRALKVHAGALKQRIFFLHHPNVAFQGRDVIVKWIEILYHDIFREKAEK